MSSEFEAGFSSSNGNNLTSTISNTGSTGSNNWLDTSWFGSADSNGNAIAGSGADNIGGFIDGLGSLGSLWSSIEGINNNDELRDMARTNSLFSQRMDLANVMNALRNQNAIKSFFGNENQSSITDFLPQETIDRLGMAGLGEQPKSNSAPKNYAAFGGTPAAPQQSILNNAPAPTNSPNSLFSGGGNMLQANGQNNRPMDGNQSLFA